jgi:ribosome modulation factor
MSEIVIQTKRKNPMWEAGYLSRLDGRSMSNNPFRSNTTSYGQWLEGWAYAGDATIDAVEPVMEQIEILDEYYLLIADTENSRVWWTTHLDGPMGRWTNDYSKAKKFKTPDILSIAARYAFTGKMTYASDKKVIQNSVRFIKCQVMVGE